MRRFLIIFSFIILACETSERKTAQPPAPSLPPAPQSPRVSKGAPRYCKAVLRSQEARILSSFVLDTYNHKIAQPGRFPLAKDNGSPQGEVVPKANFIDPGAPTLLFSQAKPSNFHATLCYHPRIPHHFQCDALDLGASVAEAHPGHAPGVKDYVEFYKDLLHPTSFSLDAPQVFGPFLSLPLQPSLFKDPYYGKVVSAKLHISLVEVITAPVGSVHKSASEGLKATFLQALHQGFSALQTSLPHLAMDAVECH